MSSIISYERIDPRYFDEDAIMIQPRPVYRLSGHGGGRYYYTFDPSGEPTFYISVTTFIHQNAEMSPHLMKWIADKGWEEAEAYKEERAIYGTAMHLQFQDLLINRKLNFDDLDDWLKGYLEENKEPAGLYEAWIDDLKKDCLAMAQWMIDHQVKPLMIEQVLAGEILLPDGSILKVAGALDNLCKLTIMEKGLDYSDPYKSGARQGEPREVKMETEIIGLIDFKSGRKGFYAEHAWQLKTYEQLLHLNFPQFKDEAIRLFNFAPKDWRGDTATYTFTEQTNYPRLNELPGIMMKASARYQSDNSKISHISGVIDLDDPGSVEACHKRLDLSETIRVKHIQKKGGESL